MANPLSGKPSIAVLPFDNMSADPEQEYLADGLAEDLITDLAKISGLTVIARNSTFAYKGRSPDVREVAEQLNVRFVVEGMFPVAARMGRRNKDHHTVFLALTSSADHVLPFKRGGTSDLSNMVTACRVCQFGRREWTLEEVGISDPRLRPPIIDAWDGLVRIL